MDGENDKVIESQIQDIKNLIKFYEGLGESNPHLNVYVNKLHEQLNKLINEQKDRI